MELAEAREASLGAKLFCPWCGKEIPGDSVYCEFCGRYIQDEGEPAKKKKRSLRWLGAGVAGLVLIFAVALMMNRGNDVSGEDLFYIKDNSVYERDNESGESKELVSDYLESWNGRSAGGLLQAKQKEESSGVVMPAYSPSGRYLFSLERGIKGSFDLIRTDLKKNETKVLDSGVTEFLPVQDGQVVYKKEKGALYCFDQKRKIKLAENVTYYKANESGNLLLWETEEEGTKDIYLRGLSEKDEKIRLERNARLLDAAPDFSTFLIQKEDTVFLIDPNGEKEKLIEEAESAMAADASARTFYFTRTAGTGKEASYTELYYYASGKPELLDDSFREIVWQEETVLLYTGTEDTTTTILASEGEIFDLGMEISLAEQAGIKGGRLYFLSPDDPDSRTGGPEYELCSVNLSGSEQGRAAVIDRGVSEIAYISDERAYYYKNSSNGTGDLYCDGERMAYDVAAGSVAEVPVSGSLLCIADASGAGKKGTLYLASGKEMTALADNVAAYSAVSGTEIYMLSDYNSTKGRGSLLLYNGRETAVLEEDIWGFYETGNSGLCR